MSIRIRAEQLQTFAKQLLTQGGFSETESELISRSLVDSNLRGYSSHGVMRIPTYITMLGDGTLNSGVELKVEKETDSLLVTDGQWGVGQAQATRLLNRLLEKAENVGLAVGSMHQSGHIGRLGEYCESAAAKGFVSLVLVNSHGAVARMSPPGGCEPRLSTNPLAFGVPNGEEPLIADFSTSATAEGRVRVKKIAGEEVPQGWLLNSKGEPTTDPNDLYTTPPGSILPMGGEQAYKGFALGLMVEILAGALSGGVTARAEKYPKNGNCVFMLLLRPESFGGQAHFAAEVKQLLDYVRSSKLAPGYDKITLPGDPERSYFAKSDANGIEFDSGNWKQLVDLAESLQVAAPETI